MEITTLKLHSTFTDQNGNPLDIYELIISDANELRYNKCSIENKTIEDLWNSSTTCDYIKARELEYPSWSEQFDDQYWDKKNGTNTWLQKIEQVKLKYPKQV